MKVSGVHLLHEMNIEKMTYRENEHAGRRKKNFFVTIIHFSFSIKVYFTLQEGRKHHEVFRLYYKLQIHVQCI